jgi:branched-chain amino acid transport system substrate-binding protein
MRKTIFTMSAIMAAALMASSASSSYAQGTVKIGLIMAYSGQFADTAAQMDNAIKLYIKQHGDTVAGKKIEIIRKDTGGPNPDVAKRLAQELVVRDKVDVLAGFTLTPEAFGAWAAKSGVKTAYTMVSDYGPGIDAETWFQKGFKGAGGDIVGSVRMPVANPDFSAFVQRAKDLNPEAIFVFIPGGAQPPAFMKALAERGMDSKTVKVMGQGEITMDDTALKNMGDAGLGIITVFHYGWEHKSKMNSDFVKAYNADYKRNPDVFSIGGWDGMHLIYEALKKTGGKADGDSLIAAAKGMKWESPRGPISIDPETRDIVQTVYIRKVEKVGGAIQNVEFDKIDNVKDPAK